MKRYYVKLRLSGPIRGSVIGGCGCWMLQWGLTQFKGHRQRQWTIRAKWKEVIIDFSSSSFQVKFFFSFLLLHFHTILMLLQYLPKMKSHSSLTNRSFISSWIQFFCCWKQNQHSVKWTSAAITNTAQPFVPDFKIKSYWYNGRW